MKIVLASDWWPPRVGGLESQIVDLASALAARGHTVHVLTAMPGAEALPGVTVERMPVPLVGDVAVPDLRRVAAIAERIAAQSPHVVHAHGLFSTFATGAVLAASRLRIASVASIHSLLRPWPVFTGGAAILRVFLRRADTLTGVSRAVASDVARASGRNARWIPNGIHLQEWRLPRNPATAEGVRLVAAMRLAAKKEPRDHVDALRAAVTARPEADVTLTVAGDGPERGAIVARAAQLGVSDRLTLLGACGRSDVRDLLSKASVFLQPGASEAFGLAILEARAAGVPIVAMDAAGVPELVEHGRHGLLARTRHEFAAAAATLVSDDDLRAACARQAPIGLERYDWTTVVEEHEAAYAAAIEARRHRVGVVAPSVSRL